jgi:hypothetical protein
MLLITYSILIKYLHSENPHDVYFSRYIILVIKSTRITWSRQWHLGCWWGNLTGRDHLEDLGIDGRIILNWIFKKCGGEFWIGFILLKTGIDVRLL